MNIKVRQYALIILVSIILICIPIIGSPEFNESTSLFYSLKFQKRFLGTILVVLFFYLNYFYLIPKLYFSKKYILYIVLIIVCFVLILKIPHLIFNEEMIRESFKALGPDRTQRRFEPNFWQRLFFDKTLYQFIICIFISFLLRLNLQMNEMESEKLKSEVSYLKAQINPHFLFNTLNSLYALTLEKSDEAPEAILKLSAIMRYIVTESSKEMVLLKDEIEYVKDYIDLQKLRMVEDTVFSFTITGTIDQQKIAPLLLIPFIENAFKHGLNPDKNCYIHIKINIEKKVLYLIVENSKSVEIFPSEKSEKGLDNTLKRLQYNYPGKHELTISDTDNDYKVTLKIDL